MKKKLFLLVGVVAVAAILLFAAVLPSFLSPPLTHKEEIELYSPNMLLVFFYVSTEWAEGYVPPRFSVSEFIGTVFIMLMPGTFSFRGNVYPVFLAIAAVVVEPLGVGPSAQWGWYVAKMFCNDTRVITILRGGYNIPCDYVEVDYSFQTGETAKKSFVTLNDADGNPLLYASIIWPDTATATMHITNNYYHLVGNNLTIGHRQVQTSLSSINTRANVTFPLNTFFFELTGVNYLFNTAYCTTYGDWRERGEIGWLTWS